MRYFLTASKDTTIYQRYPTNNAGLDEIVEVGKVRRPDDLEIALSSSAARILLDFDLSNSGSYSSSASYFLNLKIANASKLKMNQQISVYTVSRSWTEGSGYFVQQTVNASDGATWREADTAVSWSNYGGDYNANSVQTTLNGYPLPDLRIDVTSLIAPIVSSSLAYQQTGTGSVIPWNGLLVKFPNSSELDIYNEGNVKFFSHQTHTVHELNLEVAWDDSIFTTGSVLRPITSTTETEVVARNPKAVYLRGAKEKLRLVARDKYPPKTFDSILRYKNKYYLPSTSYISIVDQQADTTIIPFDDSSKISCDSDGSFFILDTTPLYKNRYYTVNVKVDNGDSDTTFYNSLFTFLVK